MGGCGPTARSLARLQLPRLPVVSTILNPAEVPHTIVNLLFTRVVPLLVVALASVSGQIPLASQAQFQVTVTGVMVPVYVRQNGQVVTQLKADDFVLHDSSVLQVVRAIEPGVVPLDVSVIIENSEVAEYTKDRYARELADVRRLLRREDRLRLVGVGNDLAEVLPLSAVATGSEIPTLPLPGTWFALYDGVASVLVRAAVAGRQHVVFVLSGTYDSLSMTGSEVLLEVARHSSAQVHILTRPRHGSGTRRVTMHPVPAPAVVDWEPVRQAGLRQQVSLTQRQRTEAQDRDLLERLMAVVTATGGTRLRSNLFTGSIAGPLQRVLDQVRTSYILYYTPTGVPDIGWHPITVTMKDPAKKYEIRARPGFMR